MRFLRANGLLAESVPNEVVYNINFMIEEQKRNGKDANLERILTENIINHHQSLYTTLRILNLMK